VPIQSLFSTPLGKFYINAQDSSAAKQEFLFMARLRSENFCLARCIRHNFYMLAARAEYIRLGVAGATLT
jgi:hypothetical protein